MSTMRATVFHGINDIRVEDVPKPKLGRSVPRRRETSECQEF